MDKQERAGIGQVLVKLLFAILLMALALWVTDFTGRHINAEGHPSPAAQAVPPLKPF
jgi:hypothetical protein